MILQTKPFGLIELDEASIVTLVEPLAGFPGKLRFAIIRNPRTFPLVWLQAVDDPDLCFPMINPMFVRPDYSVALSAHQRLELGFTNGTLPEVFTLVVVPEDAAQTTTNLRAPLVVNSEQRLAKQFILERADYAIRHPLASAAPGGSEQPVMAGA